MWCYHYHYHCDIIIIITITIIIIIIVIVIIIINIIIIIIIAIIVIIIITIAIIIIIIMYIVCISIKCIELLPFLMTDTGGPCISQEYVVLCRHLWGSVERVNTSRNDAIIQKILPHTLLSKSISIESVIDKGVPFKRWFQRYCRWQLTGYETFASVIHWMMHWNIMFGS